MVITKTPTARTRIRAANQRRRRGSQVKIVLIVPVCQDTATNEAPITSPRMLVIDEIALEDLREIDQREMRRHVLRGVAVVLATELL